MKAWRPMHITYRGGAQGLAMLTAELEASGVDVTYEPPMEQRDSAGQVALEVTLWIADQAGGEIVGAATLVGVRAAVQAVKSKWPKLEVELKDPSPESDA